MYKHAFGRYRLQQGLLFEAGNCNTAMHHCLFYIIYGWEDLTNIRDCQDANPIG